MKLFNFAATVLLLTQLVSCGGSNKTIGSQSSSASVNGQDPKSAYSTFLTQEEGSCEESSYKITRNPFKIAYPGKKTGYILVDLYLFPDGRAHAEVLQIENYAMVQDQSLNFTWEISGTNLVVNGLGTASYLTSNGEPTLMLSIADGLYEKLKLTSIEGLENKATMSTSAERLTASTDTKTCANFKENLRK